MIGVGMYVCLSDRSNGRKGCDQPSTKSHPALIQPTHTQAASQWQKTMLLTTLLFPCAVVSVTFGLNLLAEMYDTTHALHLATILKVRREKSVLYVYVCDTCT